MLVLLFIYKNEKHFNLTEFSIVIFLDSLKKEDIRLENVIENRLNCAEVPAELTWDLSDLYNSDAE